MQADLTSRKLENDMPEKPTVVLTTIQSPRSGIETWTGITDLPIIIVGDRKTPHDWAHPNCEFLSFDSTHVADFALPEMLPENHYARKNIGYLDAIRKGAKSILDTDDDNFPHPRLWNEILGGADGIAYQSPNEISPVYRNVYSYFSQPEIPFWPRGFPLSELLSPTSALEPGALQIQTNEDQVAVWQGLVDQDPDIDAIHRLLYAKSPAFENKPKLILGRNNLCPFNSQNTLWKLPIAFPLLYLPSTVSFRFTDILRGYVAQIILHAHDLHLGFTRATATQERNQHDIMKDFASETSMYLQTTEIVESLSSKVRSSCSISENLMISYEELAKMEVTREDEMKMVESWLSDLRSLV